jgi:hypothetical protein
MENVGKLVGVCYCTYVPRILRIQVVKRTFGASDGPCMGGINPFLVKLRKNRAVSHPGVGSRGRTVGVVSRSSMWYKVLRTWNEVSVGGLASREGMKYGQSGHRERYSVHTLRHYVGWIITKYCVGTKIICPSSSSSLDGVINTFGYIQCEYRPRKNHPSKTLPQSHGTQSVPGNHPPSRESLLPMYGLCSTYVASHVRST